VKTATAEMKQVVESGNSTIDLLHTELVDATAAVSALQSQRQKDNATIQKLTIQVNKLKAESREEV
jgi:hypothetical protein